MYKLLAKFLARPSVAAWLIKRSQRTPYTHLDGYMNRWWLFNPYTPVTEIRSLSWLPFSVRVHHILRPDDDRALHDHPWDARTFILCGWYTEVRELHDDGTGGFVHAIHERKTGDTATLNYGEYHRIISVSPGGVFTLFVTFRYRGVWGFKVNGVKVPWREYLGIDKETS